MPCAVENKNAESRRVGCAREVVDGGQWRGPGGGKRDAGDADEWHDKVGRCAAYIGGIACDRAAVVFELHVQPNVGSGELVEAGRVRGLNLQSIFHVPKVGRVDLPDTGIQGVGRTVCAC